MRCPHVWGSVDCAWNEPRLHDNRKQRIWPQIALKRKCRCGRMWRLWCCVCQQLRAAGILLKLGQSDAKLFVD